MTFEGAGGWSTGGQGSVRGRVKGERGRGEREREREGEREREREGGGERERLGYILRNTRLLLVHVVSQTFRCLWLFSAAILFNGPCQCDSVWLAGGC